MRRLSFASCEQTARGVTAKRLSPQQARFRVEAHPHSSKHSFALATWAACLLHMSHKNSTSSILFQEWLKLARCVPVCTVAPLWKTTDCQPRTPLHTRWVGVSIGAHRFWSTAVFHADCLRHTGWSCAQHDARRQPTVPGQLRHRREVSRDEFHDGSSGQRSALESVFQTSSARFFARRPRRMFTRRSLATEGKVLVASAFQTVISWYLVKT